jgi:hypothetical protein
MAEAHQAEAARHGVVVLNGRRRHAVVCAAAEVCRWRAASIFRDGKASVCQMVCSVVLLRGALVGAFEITSWVEGTAALEVSFTAVRSQGPQRHCACGGLRSHVCRRRLHGGGHGTAREKERRRRRV